jgi:hypothetical protein
MQVRASWAMNSPFVKNCTGCVATAAGQRHRMAHLRFLVRLAGALHFDIKVVRENARPALRGFFGAHHVALVDGRADVAELGAGQHDQAIRLVMVGMQFRATRGQRFEPFDAHLGAALVLVGEPGLRQQIAQLQVAGVVLGQQQQAVRFLAVVVVGDPRVDANDRFHALAARRFIEAHHAKQVGQVGDGQRPLLVFGGRSHHVVDAHQAIDDRVFGVHAQVRKSGGKCRSGHGTILTRHAAWEDFDRQAAMAAQAVL